MIKARFGEANIQSCDVMLRDIIESKRVDRLIHNRTANVSSPSTPQNTTHSVRDIALTVHRLFIHGSYHDFSGLHCEMRNSSCRNFSRNNSTVMPTSTPKSRGEGNWLGWIISAPSTSRLTSLIDKSQSRLRPSKHLYYTLLKRAVSSHRILMEWVS